MVKEEFDSIQKMFDSIEAHSSIVEKYTNSINEEHKRLQKLLKNLYDFDKKELFFIHFDNYSVDLYRLTKEKVINLHFTWYGLNKAVFHRHPTFDQACLNIDKMYNENKPTNVEIRSYETFGHFHDTNEDVTWESWVAEKLMKKEYLFSINAHDFTKALYLIYETLHA